MFRDQHWHLSRFNLLSFRLHSERRCLLGVLFLINRFCSEWSYLIRNLFFCFCVLFSKIYPNTKFHLEGMFWSPVMCFIIYLWLFFFLFFFFFLFSLVIVNYLYSRQYFEKSENWNKRTCWKPALCFHALQFLHKLKAFLLWEKYGEKSRTGLNFFAKQLRQKYCIRS